MARRLGHRAAEARGLWNIVVANVYGAGDVARAVEAGEASLEIARELADREQLAFTLNDVSRAHMAAGDLEIAELRLEEARNLWEGLDNRPMLAENRTIAGSIRLLSGDHAAAMAEGQRALAIASSIDNAWGQAAASITVYRCRLDQGDIGPAIEEIHRTLELGERGGFVIAGVLARADLARTLVDLGDLRRALELADRAVDLALQNSPVFTALASIPKAEVLRAMGRHAEANEALRDIDVRGYPEPDRTFSMTAQRLTASALALDADDPLRAETIATELVEDLRRGGVRILVAEGLLARARARISSGTLEEAEADLAAAVEEADRLGERRVLWRALALTADLRDRVGAAGADDLRRRAAGIVDGVAAGISDEDLRASFLARDDVVALTGGS